MMSNPRGKSRERLLSSLRYAVEETEDLVVAFDKLYGLEWAIEDAQTLHETQALIDRMKDAGASIVSTAITIDLSISLSPHMSDDSEGGDDAR